MTRQDYDAALLKATKGEQTTLKFNDLIKMEFCITYLMDQGGNFKVDTSNLELVVL